MPSFESRHWDVLIVGAGSAGCVMAHRLSENPDCRVALLEAGAEHNEASTVQAVRDGNQPAVRRGLNWKYRTFIKGNGTAPAAGEPSIFNYEAGRLLGGSSSVNATQALRPSPGDFDEWALRCGDTWSWAQVMPYFRKLEDDPLGPSDVHGSGGPMPIRRESVSQLTPMHASFMQACVDQGFPQTEDHNAPDSSGVGVIPRNVVHGVRVSTAMAYLDPARSRPNLDVIAGAHVHRLTWTPTVSGQCSGVEVELDGQLVHLQADTVIICAGVIGTPALLMRSGVGMAEELRTMGIPVQLPLFGVGQHLQEHPVVGVWGLPAHGLGNLGEPLRQTLLAQGSDASQRANVHTCLMTGFDTKEMFPHAATLGDAPTLSGLTVCYNGSVSKGRVRLADSDARTPPLVWNNCLGDPSDVRPLVEGLLRGWDLLQQPCLSTKFDRILAWTDRLIHTPKALEQAVRTFVRPAAHACGTARMGRHPDDGDVVNPDGRLHGATNVWIGDASVMPRAPSAPPHLTCLMVAEKMADHLKARVLA